jgi:phosphomannomutase / phosphoglucomutase
MDPAIFREYDIRGIVGSELLIEETYDLGKAIGTYFKQEYPEQKTVLVGRDGRTHSQPIVHNVIEALTDLGFDIIDLGVIPTPVLYFAVHQLNRATALIVTASHNPKEYNGIKVWGAWGQRVQAIRKIFEEKKFYQPTSVYKGTVSFQPVRESYLDYLVEHFSHLKDKSLKAVIDCGNGTAGSVIPELVARMGWRDVKVIFDTVDGDFPNHEADPTVLENMLIVRDILANSDDFEVGIGFDGDADRMNPMTKSGVLVAGDKLLALYAQKVLQRFPGASIVFDIKSSAGLIELLEQWSAKPVISPSGHSLIKKAMKENNALLAGELSCHFFFKDIYFGYDDGIYAALRLFEILEETGKTLDQLLTLFPHKETTPEIRMKCNSDEEKMRIVEQVKAVFAHRKDIDLIMIDGMRVQMSYGWGLIRASNTQPVLCLRFESTTHEGLTQVKKDFYETLVPFFTTQQLKDIIAW